MFSQNTAPRRNARCRQGSTQLPPVYTCQCSVHTSRIP